LEAFLRVFPTALGVEVSTGFGIQPGFVIEEVVLVKKLGE
jgi:hypothetical protein